MYNTYLDTITYNRIKNNIPRIKLHKSIYKVKSMQKTSVVINLYQTIPLSSKNLVMFSIIQP